MSGLPPNLNLQQLMQLMQIMRAQQSPQALSGGGPAAGALAGLGNMLPGGIGSSSARQMPGMGPSAGQMPGMGPSPGAPQMPIKSMKKGGVIEKTGVYRLHKGERVVPAGKTRHAMNTPKKTHEAPKKTAQASVGKVAAMKKPAGKRR